jgi:hypothetical protein
LPDHPHAPQAHQQQRHAQCDEQPFRRERGDDRHKRPDGSEGDEERQLERVVLRRRHRQIVTAPARLEVIFSRARLNVHEAGRAEGRALGVRRGHRGLSRDAWRPAGRSGLRSARTAAPSYGATVAGRVVDLGGNSAGDRVRVGDGTAMIDISCANETTPFGLACGGHYEFDVTVRAGERHVSSSQTARVLFARYGAPSEQSRPRSDHSGSW